MWSRKDDTAQTCETRSFWRVGTARNATFVHSCVAAAGLQRQLPKTGGRERPAAQDGAKERFGNQNRQKLAWSDGFLKSQAAKFAPGCGERAVWKSNSLKDGMMGALLEGQVGKICTTLWYESGWEVKSLKTVAASEHFLVEPCKICTRLRRENRLEVKFVERWYDIWEHFWKVRSAKFVPRYGARAVRKSKSLKTGGQPSSQVVSQPIKQLVGQVIG